MYLSFHKGESVRKWIVLLSLCLFACLPAFANQAAQGWCEQGNVTALTQGLNSTNTVQGSYPQCQVNVYLHGTQTLATIYSDNNISPTPLPNPFTAGANGTWLFYAAYGHYDVTLSGGLNGGFPQPYTLTDIILQDCGAAQCGNGGGVDAGTHLHLGQYDSSGHSIEQTNVTMDSDAGNSMTVPGQVTAFQVNQHFYTAGAVVGNAINCPNGGATQLECALNAAKAYATANSVTTIVHTLPSGVNALDNAISFTGAQRVRIKGEGKETTKIQWQGATLSGAMISYGCMSGTSDADPVGVTDATFDGNKLAGSGLFFAAQNESELQHLIFRNFTSSTVAPLQVGSTSCGGGSTGSTFQNAWSDIYVDAKGTGPNSWAQTSITVGGGIPVLSSITSGGLYNYAAPPVYIHGFGAGANPCTTMGTATAVTAASGGQFTLTGINFSGFSGCVAGNGIYAFVPDLSPAPYGIDFQFGTDGAGYMLMTNGFKVGIHNTNSANSFYASHPYNGYVGVQDDSGANWYGTDCDSNLIMFDIKAPGLFSGCSAFYNNTNSPGAMMFLLENGQNGSTFFGNKVVTASMPSDYHQFVTTAGGPVDTGQGSWPANSVDFGSPTAEANALSARHVTGYQNVDDYVGAKQVATAGANWQSFNRFWCPSVWNGGSPQNNCWGISSNPSASGVPTQESIGIFPPTNRLAPISGLFFLWNSPGNATSGSNLNSITVGLRGSYNDGSNPHSIGWNFIAGIGTGTSPFNTLFLSPTFCVSGCEINTSANIHLTGSAFFQAGTYNLSNGSFLGSVVPTTLSAARTYTFPDASGTVAFTAQNTVVRAGSVTITGSTTAAATFSPSMTATPDSCVLQPTTDPTAVGGYWPTALATTGFTANVHTSGTITLAYTCVKNNSN